jgi:hypothetical protein
VDAFGAILNEISATFLGIDKNWRAANTPVNYPFIWDAPQHDFVQWNGAGENHIYFAASAVAGTDRIGVLGRNCGEVLGTFGFTDPTVEHGFVKGYRSSVNKENLIEIEEMVCDLWSPLWPDELGPIDEQLADQGYELYRQNCDYCHKSDFDRTNPGRYVDANVIDVETDETMARNFTSRLVKTGVMEGRKRRLFGRAEPIEAVESADALLRHVVLKTIVGPELHFGRHQTGQPSVVEENSTAVTKISAAVTKSQFATNTPDRTPSIDSAPALSDPADLSTKEYAYKARPLNGIWATAPFFHNGSVPNLYELLLPADQRSKKFFVAALSLIGSV